MQWAWRRLGIRAEWVGGDRPSTLLALEPEFAPAYRARGASPTAGAVFSMLRLTDADQVYGRYDQFNGDPVYGYDVRAFNIGYFRRIGAYSRIGHRLPVQEPGDGQRRQPEQPAADHLERGAMKWA